VLWKGSSFWATSDTQAHIKNIINIFYDKRCSKFPIQPEYCVPCCNVRYDFRIKTIFGSALPPVVCRRAHVLFTFFVFVCVLWCPTQMSYCVVLLFLFFSVLCTLCRQFLWIVHFLLPFRYFLTFNLCESYSLWIRCTVHNLFQSKETLLSHAIFCVCLKG